MAVEPEATRSATRRRRVRHAGGLGACLLTVVGLLATAAVAPAVPAGASSYGFSDPTGIAFDGRDIWVTNYTGNSVTELNGSTGAWVRTFSAPSRGFDEPDGIVFVDNLQAGPSSVWVTNTMGNSVTELPTSGGASHVVDAASCHFDRPGGITTDGTDLWVTNGASNTVTEIQASDQTCIRTLSGGRYGFDFPNAITYDGSHIWVANQSGNSLTEIDDSDGSWVRTFSAPSRGF
jgi:DNA-binding beta-propeller fold protein YncE